MSGRHLANLEYGIRNASMFALPQIADALACSLVEIGDVTTSSPEWRLIQELLENRGEATLAKCVRQSVRC
jgi:XRE family aerobic/anaerobic benzoate catabolism transcriptional regulator